jgi:ribulose-phosphate 3-epimerase
MITDPDFFFDEFAEAGSDSFIVHWEGNNNLHRTIQRVKDLGKPVGLAINPATPASVLEEVLADLDLVLVMTVNPGFGHQRFIPSTLPKIQRVRRMIDECKPDCELELDGGIDAATAQLGVAAGADVLVAGSSIFADREGVDAAMKRLSAPVNDAVNQGTPWPSSNPKGIASSSPGLRGTSYPGLEGRTSLNPEGVPSRQR